MKKTISSIIVVIVITSMLTSCKNKTTNKNETASDTSKTIREKVLTAEEQKALTPDMVIQRLKDGNKRFLDNNLTTRDHSSQIRDAVQGQFPKAVILSCMDSRVPVEDIFDAVIGDLFVCRVAGNVLNEDMLASLEYGCKVSGAKIIVVMGHGHCGAVESAIKEVQLGNITQLLAKVKPAIEESKNFTGEKKYTNEDYVNEVVINNAKIVVKEIMKKSPILKEMVDKGELKVVSAAYDLKNGEVTFFE